MFLAIIVAFTVAFCDYCLSVAVENKVTIEKGACLYLFACREVLVTKEIPSLGPAPSKPSSPKATFPSLD